MLEKLKPPWYYYVGKERTITNNHNETVRTDPIMKITNKVFCWNRSNWEREHTKDELIKHESN